MLFLFKVLVIITDAQSSSSEKEIQQAVRPLENDGVHVIPVAVGDSADPGQLEEAARDKTDVITASEDEDPAELGEKIMNKAKQREFTFRNVI